MIEWSIGVGCLLAVFVLLVRTPIAPLFTRDVEVRHLLVGALLVVALLQPLAGWVFALDGILIGAGDIRYIAFAQAITVCVFAPIAAAVLVLHLGLTGLWCGIGVWMFARLIVMAWRERGNAWAVVGAVRR